MLKKPTMTLWVTLFFTSTFLLLGHLSSGQISTPPDTINKIRKVKKGYKTFYYDSKGRSVRKYRKEKFFRKGFACYYDTLGQVTARGHIKLSQRHGRWKIRDNGQYTIKHYKYGLEKHQQYTSENKRMNIILTYGYAPRIGKDETHYIIYQPVTGCIVTFKVSLITGVHNWPVRAKKRIRYGKKWDA